MIAISNLNVRYNDKLIIDQFNMMIPENEITSIIGPNGSGKSTLIKSIANLIKFDGVITLYNKSVKQYKHRELAKTVSYLPQMLSMPAGLSVRRLVEYGRYPYVKQWGRLKKQDHNKIQFAIDALDLTSLGEQPLESLSGGQQQRAWIAMLLAQDTKIILMDEPTSYLDIAHQAELMKLLLLLKSLGKTLVVVLHDINQACQISDNVGIVKMGSLIDFGVPNDVMTVDRIDGVYGVKSRTVYDSLSNKPLFILD